MFHLSNSRELEAEADYSDESFEESEDPERTPTFEFNMTPPSIGNSGCGDSNDDFHLKRREEKDHTASDVSDIEDQPAESFEEVSERVCKGEERQSSWNSSDYVSSEAGQQTLEEKELYHQEFVEIKHENKIINDVELNRMDEEIFVLLQPTEQSARVSDQKRTEYQSDTKVQEKDSNRIQEAYLITDLSSGSRTKSVRFASEPEVFEVPFSSREFDEPFFDETDAKSQDEVQSDSRLKNVNLDPYSQEFADDLDNLLDNIEQDIHGDIQEEQEDNKRDNEVDLFLEKSPVYKQQKEDCSGKTRSVENDGSDTDLLHENENTPFKAVCENASEVMNHKKAEKNFVLREMLNYAGLSSEKSEESPPMTEQSAEVPPQNTQVLFEDTDPRPSTSDKDCSFTDEALALNLKKYETANSVTDEGTEYNDQTAEEVSQKCKEAFPRTNSTCAVSPTQVDDMFSKEEVITVSHGYTGEFIDNEVRLSTCKNTKSQDHSKCVMGQEAESPTNGNEHSGSEINPGVETTERKNTPHEVMISRNSEQFCLQDNGRCEKMQTGIAGSCEKFESDTSFPYKETEDNTVSKTCGSNNSEGSLPESEVTIFSYERPNEKIEGENRDKEDQIVGNTTSAEEVEFKVIATELEHLKNLHVKISDLHEELNAGKKSDYEKRLVKRISCQSRVSLLEEFRIIMMSVTEMSEDLTTALNQVMEDSAQHSISQLATLKGEYFETLDKRKEEIESLKQCNEELQIQLEEGDLQRRTIECIIKSVNIENEKLLQQNDDLEDELNKALAEKNEILVEMERKNSEEEYRERELSNLKDDMRWKNLNLQEIYASWDQMCNDKERLEKDVDSLTVSLEQSEAAKLELEKELKEMEIGLENIELEQKSKNSINDYAYLQEEVEHLKGLLVLSNLDKERLTIQLQSTVKASAISSDVEEFAQQKELFKSRIEKQISELQKQNSFMLQELAQTSEISKAKDDSKMKVAPMDELLHSSFAKFEKQLEAVHDELSQLRNECLSLQTQEKRKSKQQYKRIKETLVCNEENIKWFAQSLQLDMKELKNEFEQDFKFQIRNDIREQFGMFFKDCTGIQVNQEGQDTEIKELKKLLEKAISVQKNEQLTTGKENCEKCQDLENMLQELNKLLQEIKLHLESNEKKLNERDHAVEELNWQLDKERKNKEQQLIDKQGEVNKLQRLLSDSDNNAEYLHGLLREINKQLEGAKETLAQRDTELAKSKASLYEADDLLSTSRYYIIEMQRELEKEKGMLKEKCVALEYMERYAQVLCKSTRSNDFEIGAAMNQLMNTLERDVKRMGKLLQSKTEKKAFKHKGRLPMKEIADDRSDDLNEADSQQIQHPLLQEREKEIEHLESNIVQLKSELERSNVSLKEKGNGLQQIKNELQGKVMENKDLESSICDMKRELELSNTALEEKHNELQKMKMEFQKKDVDIKELESSIRDLRQDLETSNTSLKEKNNKLQQIRDEFQEKVMEKKGLESYMCDLKRELEMSNTSLQEKENELQQMRSALQEKVLENKDLGSSMSDLKRDLEKSNTSLKERQNEVQQMTSELQKEVLENKDLESSISDLKRGLEMSNASLKEKQNELQQMTSELQKKVTENKELKSSISDQTRDLELSSNSLEEKEYKLQQITSDLQRKEMELKETKERSGILDDRNSLQIELMEIRTLVSQQDNEIKEMKRLAFTKDSDLRKGSWEMEQLQHQLEEKEQTIDLLKRGLGAKEHEVTSMTENLKTKLFEIMRLQKKLDSVKIENRQSFQVYQMKARYLEAVAARLKNDLEGQTVLLRVKDNELTKANLGVQVKEEEVDDLKERLYQLEQRFKLYKQISTEREFKLAQEKKVLEEKASRFQTHLDKKENDITWNESETQDNIQNLESKREDLAIKNNENLDVVMAKLAGEQIAVAMTDRIQQMMADMNGMQAELESKREENAQLLKVNKELKGQVDKLQKEAIEQTQKLNNALDHVRMKRVEIRRLKALQNVASADTSKVGLLIYSLQARPALFFPINSLKRI